MQHDQKRERTMSLNGIVSKEHRKEFKQKFPEIMPTAYPAYLKINKEQNYREANLFLLRLSNELTVNNFNYSWDDDQLCDWCEKQAKRMKNLCKKAKTSQGRLLICQEELESYSLELPETNHPTSMEPILERLKSAKWWRLKMRKLQKVKLDQIARNVGIVNRRQQIYISDDVHKRTLKQRKRNRHFLESNIAENEFGEEYSLAELSDKSTSKPENRRNELMVRIRGFEEYAKLQSHSARFFTLTCPSRFHIFSKFTKNKNYKGANVKEAQNYLKQVWAQTRAKLNRSNIRCYGFRVAEPHNDGCPHWHMLLWFENEGQAEEASKIMRQYSLKDSPNEKGAQKHRFTVSKIDPKKGSAVGYLAKYISKSIDGYGVDEDLYGLDAKDSAKRISSWASCYSIRQFQQIGGPSVTVWRELRRLDSDQSGDFGDLVKAADAADWCAFNILMGGGFVKRDEQTVRAAYWLEFDPETGEEIDKPYTEYGDISKGKLFGVYWNDSYILTREYRWTIKHKTESIHYEAVTEDQRLKAEARLINEVISAIDKAEKEPVDPQFIYADGMRLKDFLGEQRSPLDLCQ